MLREGRRRPLGELRRQSLLRTMTLTVCRTPRVRDLAREVTHEVHDAGGSRRSSVRADRLPTLCPRWPRLAATFARRADCCSRGAGRRARHRAPLPRHRRGGPLGDTLPAPPGGPFLLTIRDLVLSAASPSRRSGAAGVRQGGGGESASLYQRRLIGAAAGCAKAVLADSESGCQLPPTTPVARPIKPRVDSTRTAPLSEAGLVDGRRL